MCINISITYIILSYYCNIPQQKRCLFVYCAQFHCNFGMKQNMLYSISYQPVAELLLAKIISYFVSQATRHEIHVDIYLNISKGKVLVVCKSLHSNISKGSFGIFPMVEMLEPLCDNYVCRKDVHILEMMLCKNPCKQFCQKTFNR